MICANSGAEDLASEINTVLKAELEKEFGPLDDRIMANDKLMWGRVTSIDCELPVGTDRDRCH